MNTENNVLTPYEYWYCKQQISELVSAYHSVNDKQTVVTLQTLIQGIFRPQSFTRRILGTVYEYRSHTRQIRKAV